MNKVHFSVSVGFYETVKHRVNAYFLENSIARTGDWRMFLKTGMIAAWLAVSYTLLVFFSSSLIVAILAAFALAQGLAFVGFNVSHDGAHGSYSGNKKVNWLMGLTLDLIGGSQMLWRQKHNILHHTYTNIDEVDDDLRMHGLLRLSPGQKRRPWHRFQHLYAFPVYSLLTLSLVTFSDFKKFFSGRIGEYRLRKPTASEAFLFFLMKAFYFGYTLALPLFFHPLLHVLIAFLAVHLVLGFTLSIVFQMAHTIEGTAFPQPDPGTALIQNEWAVHEVETTANFAPKNRLAAWCLGGLNFQIEPHLFPRVCHIHYPAISRIVKETCREFSISYVSYPTLRSTVAGHYRFLKGLGATRYPEPGNRV